MDKEDKGPDLSPEGLADWIGQIEDKVWVAARDAAASRFLLGNLVLELGRTGVIDAGRLIRGLLAEAPQHPDCPQAIQELLEELQRCLPESEDNDGSGEPGVPRVFH